MKYFRIVALVLCVVFLVCAVSFSAAVTVSGIDLNSAMSAFAPDTVMLRAGDLSVDWGILYLYLFNEVAQISDFFQSEVDWSEPSPNGDGTLADSLKNYLVESTRQFIVYDYGVRELNLSLDEPYYYEIQQIVAELNETYPTPALLNSVLHAEGFINMDVLTNYLTSFYLHNYCLPIQLYGENFDNMSDEETANYAELNGYMRAKHILLSVQPPPSETGDDSITEAEWEAQTASQLETAERILDELNSRINDADFLEFFDEQMYIYSDDPGSYDSPTGYLFQFYDMSEPFSAACEALEFGQLSGIVETEHGYHIILRLPLDFDTVPVAYANQGQYSTLRQLAAFDDFEYLFDFWSSGVGEIEPTDAFVSLDIGKLFKWH